MRHIELNAQFSNVSGVLDPAPYLQQLPRLSASLPPGARAFATDPGHYDFSGKRCTKDLTLDRITRVSQDLSAHFRHNCWKHDEDLVITYSSVTDIRSDSPDGPDWDNLHTVILDEVLPTEDGCTHEIAFRPGTLTIACNDLTATWVPSDCHS